MRKEEKNIIIDKLSQQIAATKHFYLTDISELNAVHTSALRRKCFESKIQLEVVKNTLFRNALIKAGNNNEELIGSLVGNTSVMFSESANAPARLIKEFRKKHPKPLLKAAFVEESVYIGDNQLDTLATLKSKEELVGDIIMLLQSPIKKVLSQLQSGKNILGGIVKTLSERTEKTEEPKTEEPKKTENTEETENNS